MRKKCQGRPTRECLDCAELKRLRGLIVEYVHWFRLPASKLGSPEFKDKQNRTPWERVIDEAARIAQRRARRKGEE